MIDLYETRKATSGKFSPREDLLLGEAGFVMLRNFFEPYRLTELLGIAKAEPFPSRVLLSMEPDGHAAVRAALGVHDVLPFDAVCLDRQLVDEAEKILGGECYVHQSRINFKREKTGSGWSWHSDFETWHAQDGMTRPLAVTAMIPLESNTQQNGPLMVIPGSHAIYWSAPCGEEHDALENFSDQKDGVPSSDDIAELKRRVNSTEIQVLCEPGDVFFFDCNLMHGSVPNLSAGSRTNLYIVFNRADNELVAPYSASAPRPVQMGYRN